MPALPHITLLMGTRNGAAHLHQQLAALAAQTHEDWALWVSDDGSSDRTRDILREFAQTHPNPVILFKGPEQGLAANYLSLLCHPDLPPGPVALADQDDLWLPTHLTRGLTALLQDDTSAGQAFVPNRMVLPPGQAPRPLRWRVARPPDFRNALVECLLPGSGLILDAHAVALARRAGRAQVPFWDWWLYLLLTGAGARILHDPSPGLFYRSHAANTLGPRTGLRAALWRIGKLTDGSYARWLSANLAALETHMALLTPEAQAILRPLLPMPHRPRLRQLSRHRQWRQDRLALWLVA